MTGHDSGLEVGRGPGGPAAPRTPSPRSWARIGRAIDERIADMHPAYFAMSMATGVVSIASHLLQIAVVAQALLAVNVIVYPALLASTAYRIAKHRARVASDLGDHTRGVGFFTTVAATSILGSQMAVVRHDLSIGRALLFPAIALWLGCMYTVFASFTVREGKPGLAEGINGGWLTAVVATQSICVLACFVAPTFAANQELVLFMALTFWLCGGMLYIWMI